MLLDTLVGLPVFSTISAVIFLFYWPYTGRRNPWLAFTEPWLKTTEMRSSWHDKDMNRAVSGAWAAKLPLIAYLYLPDSLSVTFPLNCCGHNPRRQSLTEYTWSTCQSTLSNSDKICAFLSLCNNALSLPSNEKRQSLKHSVCSYATTTTTKKTSKSTLMQLNEIMH